jgi:Putative cyclase
LIVVISFSRVAGTVLTARDAAGGSGGEARVVELHRWARLPPARARGPFGGCADHVKGVSWDATDGNYAPGWTPPNFTVDENGKIVGYVNERTPNNWGRRGDLDERGTVNFITPERVAEAASLIRTGEVISCAIPLDSTGPVHSARTNITHFFSVTGADFVSGTTMSQLYPKLQGRDDYIIMPLQGSTQWDGLSHMGYADTFYNGFWIGNVEQFAGAKRLGIHQLKDTLVARGVLLDMARHKGVGRLEQSYAITGDDLDACIELQGGLGPHGRHPDRAHGTRAVVVRARGQGAVLGGAPGMSIKTVDWLHEKRSRRSPWTTSRSRSSRSRSRWTTTTPCTRA